LAEFPEAEIAAVWDDDPERGLAYAAEFGVPFEPDLAALLAAPDIDGVLVDSAPDQAASLIELAAKAGKHALADQTLAMTLRDANRAADWIRRSGVHFAIDMSLKRWPVNLAAKGAAESGALGRLSGVRLRNAHNGATGAAPLAPRYLDAPYGVFSDLGAHPLYLANWLLGRPEAVTAVVSRVSGRAAEDNAACLLEYADGTIAVCEASYAADHSPYAVELYGTEGSFLGGGANGVHRKLLRPSDAAVRLHAPEDRASALAEAAAMPDEAGESTLSRWLRAIADSRASDGSGGSDGERPSPLAAYVEDGIALAELLEALYLSARADRKVYLRDLEK